MSRLLGRNEKVIIMMNVIEGGLVAPKNARFALIVGRFNSFIVDRLVEGAVDALQRHGVDSANIDLYKAPGAWELPLLARRVAKQDKYDAVIALGAVIRGGTPHFEYVASECTKGLASVSLEEDLPISFGVLTVDSIEQAIERAGTKAGNKGSEAALSALEMVTLFAGMKA